ncbi:MAG TPA: hypothetical protein V6D17_02405, partial [Candidatus Obscuribacterales bacterium]
MTPHVSRLDPPTKQGPPEAEERIIIRGGKQLNGEVEVSGAKNAVLKMMAAALLAADVSVIRNVPDLTDVHMMADVMRHLGAKITIGKDEVIIDAKDIVDYEAPYELVSQLRASFVVLGPLLARFRQAKVSLPGGCAIGE